MASISKQIPLDADADTVWAAVRDVGNPHRLFSPVLTDARLEDADTRVVTFANGIVVRERILHLDDDARRLAYTVLDAPFSHHHATFAVAAEPDGTSILTWVSYVLPDEVAPMVEGLMHQGAQAAQHVFRQRAMLAS